MIETKKGFIRVTIIDLLDRNYESEAWLREREIWGMSKDNELGGAWLSLQQPNRTCRVKETLDELFEVFDEPKKESQK